jgi:exodeoxyribonuclease VII small subunit
MAELESVVTRLEQGDLPLDAALHAFERGIELSRLCQSALMDAEQTVEKLTGAPDGLSATEPFAASSDDDDSE